MSLSASDPEDVKLLTLARAHRARTGAQEGAAVRDTDGRTYSATEVGLPSLRLSALQVAVSMAVCSGGHGLEAALVVTDTAALTGDDLAVVRDFGGPEVPVYRVNASGQVVETLST